MATRDGYFSFGPIKVLFYRGNLAYLTEERLERFQLFLQALINHDRGHRKTIGLFSERERIQMSAQISKLNSDEVVKRWTRDIFFSGVEKGEIRLVKALVSQGFNISQYKDGILAVLFSRGDIGMAKLLVPFLVLSKANKKYCIHMALMAGQMEIAKYLTSRWPAFLKYIPIYAIGRLDIKSLKYLGGRGLPLASYPNLFRSRVNYGTLEEVKYLAVQGAEFYAPSSPSPTTSCSTLKYLSSQGMEVSQLQVNSSCPSFSSSEANKLLKALYIKELMKG